MDCNLWAVVYETSIACRTAATLVSSSSRCYLSLPQIVSECCCQCSCKTSFQQELDITLISLETICETHIKLIRLAAINMQSLEPVPSDRSLLRPSCCAPSPHPALTTCVSSLLKAGPGSSARIHVSSQGQSGHGEANASHEVLVQATITDRRQMIQRSTTIRVAKAIAELQNPKRLLCTLISQCISS